MAGLTRREFVVAALAGGFVLLGLPDPGAGRGSVHRCHGAPQGPHPEPRPDVDASRVLGRGDLTDTPDLMPLYDGIRAIPHIADGIRCQCGCAPLEGYRSLLTCFEGGGMALHCEICQTEGRMVVRLHQAGRTLAQIRRAVDARF